MISRTETRADASTATATVYLESSGGTRIQCAQAKASGTAGGLTVLTTTCSQVPPNAYVVVWQIGHLFTAKTFRTSLAAMYELPGIRLITGYGSVRGGGLSPGDFAFTTLPNGTVGMVYVEHSAYDTIITAPVMTAMETWSRTNRIARKLLSQGTPAERVQDILRLGSPHFPRRHTDPDDYLRRTVAYALSFPAGTTEKFGSRQSSAPPAQCVTK